MIDYTACPCCNGKRRNPTRHPMVFTCRRCGAVYGECYKGDSYEYVLPRMTAEPVAKDRIRYYDFTVVGADGVSRRHGWYDPETKLIAQVG